MGPARAAAASARSAERLTTVIAAAPARVKASTIARAAPPPPSTHTLRPLNVDTLSRQRGDESFTVRAVALQSAVADGYDGVDASKCRCRRIELVDQVGDGFLVRHRDREASKAEHAHRVQRRARSAGLDLERGVHPVDSGGGESGIVKRGREAVTHRAADDGGKSSGRRDHPSNPRSRACCTLISCCSLVAAKTWRPSSSATT